MTDTTTRATPRAASLRDENRSTTPASADFRDFIASGWAPRPETTPSPRPAAEYAAARRERLSALHPGTSLVVPAGGLKQRSNDTDYPFRAHSAFAYLTGWGADAEPDSVLLLSPRGDGHEATLFFRERAGRDSEEFYANPRIGEFWIGARPSLSEVAADLGVPTRDLGELEPTLAKLGDDALVVREPDHGIAGLVDAARGAEAEADAVLAREVSEARLVKDEFEVAELSAAIASTARGFEDIIRALPEARAHRRGERLVEGAFHTRARAEGNEVGYDTIAASGDHACILHWTRNDGGVHSGDLLLVDAGVERDSYYTADITRTLPVDGRFTPTQRLVYETVREAADAAFAIVRPGIRFREVHATAMAVIARRTAEWGMLPVTAEEALAEGRQYHRRYMVHGTSHHLGLDVHDCAQARREMYMDGVLEAGMTFTIEPGLYFQPDDLTVDERFRGIGVRIEDDVLVTADGALNLSAAIPRTADEVEEWMAALA